MAVEYSKWVTVWGNAISITERKPENYGKNLTLRYPVKMMLNGNKIRITLDNFCGNEDITVSCINIALSDGENGIIEGTSVCVRFGGKISVTVKAGERVVSDEIGFNVSAGTDIAVSMYFKEFTELRSGVFITGPLSKGYFAVGNQTEYVSLDDNTSKKTNWFYFLSDIEVFTEEKNKTLICYGDSITAQAWPDYLIQRTLKNGDGTTAVIRKAVSGTRILRQYDNITYDSYGLKGEIRFPREVFVSGADTVIIQHGINDIIHPVGTNINKFRPLSDLPTADELINGLKMYLKAVKKHGLKVYLGTLLPIEGWRTYADFREKLRCQVNDWIRTTNEADGFIDFDRAVRHKNNPSAFAPGFDSGDHLHPSSVAYRRMAYEVPEFLIKGSSKNSQM